MKTVQPELPSVILRAEITSQTKFVENEMLGQFHLTWHRKSIRMFLAKGLGDNSKSSTVYFLPLTFHEKVPKKSCLRGVPSLLVQARVTFTPWILFSLNLQHLLYIERCLQCDNFFSAVKYDIDIVLIVFVWQAVADLKSYEGYC